MISVMAGIATRSEADVAVDSDAAVSDVGAGDASVMVTDICDELGLPRRELQEAEGLTSAMLQRRLWRRR